MADNVCAVQDCNKVTGRISMVGHYSIGINRVYGCCGLEEIQGISYGASAKDIVGAVCKDAFGTKTIPKPKGYGGGLSSLFLFTCPTSKNTYKTVAHAAGDRLMEFIHENKLGKVVIGGEEVNRKYHPDHMVKVFIWTSDEQALRTWWEKEQPPVPEPPKPAVAQTGPYAYPYNGIGNMGNNIKL